MTDELRRLDKMLNCKNKNINSLIWSVILVFITGCVTPTPYIEGASTQPVSFTSIVKPTITSTIMPTIIYTPVPIVTSSRILLFDDSYKKLQEVLVDNEGCRLPCWWGITPGKTTLEGAETFLSTFTKIIGEPIVIPDGSIYITVHLTIPKELGTLSHTYKIKDNVVIGIDAYVFDWSPFLYLSNILNEYGPPDGVFITTYRYEENGNRPYIVYVIYEKLGVLLMYSGGYAENIDNTVKNCFENLYSPFVYIWSITDETFTAEEMLKKYSNDEPMTYPIAIEQAADMDIQTFYEKFKTPNMANCLVTPTELWTEP